MQTWDLGSSSLRSQSASLATNVVWDRPGTFQIARNAYRTEGGAAFFRGLGICSARAFFVNAVQWAVSSSTSLTYSPKANSKPGLRMDDESADRMNSLPSPLCYLRRSMQSKFKPLSARFNQSMCQKSHPSQINAQLAQKCESVLMLQTCWGQARFFAKKPEDGNRSS